MYTQIAKAFFASGYSVLLSLVVIPVYLTILGGEAFAIYAFSSVIGVLILMLDGGFAKVCSREASLYIAKQSSPKKLLGLVNAVVIALWLVSGLFLYYLDLVSELVANEWLISERIDLNTLTFSVLIIFLGAVVQLNTSVWTESLIGLKEHNWLYKWNILQATLRHVGGVVIILISEDIVCLIIYQFIVSVIVYLVVFIKFRVQFEIAYRNQVVADWAAFRKQIELGGQLFVSTACSSITKQMDRIILSGILVMEVFSLYSIGAQLATGLFIICGTVLTIFAPKLVTALSTSQEELVSFYNLSNQIIALFIIPVTVVFSLYSEFLATLWFGQEDVVTKIADVLLVLPIAYMFLALCAPLRVLQLAYGDMRLHMYGSIIFFVLRVPILILSTNAWGINGALFSLMLLNFIYLLSWPQLVHRKFTPELRKTWLYTTLSSILVCFSISALPLYVLEAEEIGRPGSFLVCVMVFLGNFAMLYKFLGVNFKDVFKY